MGRLSSVLCYLGAGQSEVTDAGRLLAAFNFDNLLFVANAHPEDDDHDLDLSREASLAREQAALAGLLHDGKDDWQVKAIWDPTDKDWIADAQKNHDLIVLFGQRDKADYSLPCDWSLLRSLTTPMLVINPGQKKRTRNTVLAAVDIAANTEEGLNRQIIEAAKEVADQAGAELHILSVIAISRVAADLDLVDEKKQEANFRAKYEATLYDLAEDFDVPFDRVHIIPGVPADVIRKTAKQLNVICAAIGTVQRSGLSGFIFGNTAEDLLGKMPNNVLVVPDDVPLDGE